MTKTWLITGCSRGLGREIAQAALAAGDNVVATARNPASLEPLLAQWGTGRVIAAALDVTDAAAARAAVAQAVAGFGRLDILVNNAGKADLVAIEDSSEAMFRNQVETVFFGVVNLTRAALPVLREQGSGHIIQISSLGARLGSPGLAAYQASKWAVTGFSTVLAAEVAHLGIKVTTVEPGSIRTDMSGGESMEMPPVSPAYQASVGMMIKNMQKLHGNEPCDPVKMGSLIVELSRMDAPPIRILAGSDAVGYGRMLAQQLSVEDEKWAALGMTVDF